MNSFFWLLQIRKQGIEIPILIKILFRFFYMVSEPVMTKKAKETVERLVQKYDEEDEYYLAPNNGSSTLITLVQLKDNNFDKLVDTIQLALESKNKLGFIDGFVPQPKE